MKFLSIHICIWLPTITPMILGNLGSPFDSKFRIVSFISLPAGDISIKSDKKVTKNIAKQISSLLVFSWV